MSAPIQATVTLEIPFHDVDSMNVVWHGHYIKYLEIARTALMRRFGMDIPEMKDSGCVWPVVECHVKYIRPLRYGQKVCVQASLVEYENRFKIQYEVRDSETRQLLTKAFTVQLAVRIDTGEALFESPRHLVEAIEGMTE